MLQHTKQNEAATPITVIDSNAKGADLGRPLADSPVEKAAKRLAEAAKTHADALATRGWTPEKTAGLFVLVADVAATRQAQTHAQFESREATAEAQLALEAARAVRHEVVVALKLVAADGESVPESQLALTPPDDTTETLVRWFKQLRRYVVRSSAALTSLLGPDPVGRFDKARKAVITTQSVTRAARAASKQATVTAVEARKALGASIRALTLTAQVAFITAPSTRKLFHRWPSARRKVAEPAVDPAAAKAA